MSINTVVTFSCPTTAKDLGRRIAEDLVASGFKCSKLLRLDGGVGFSAKVRRMSILILVNQTDADADRWMVMIGRGTLPIGRLLGMSDEGHRQALGDAIDSTLRAGADTKYIHWSTDESWAGRR